MKRMLAIAMALIIGLLGGCASTAATSSPADGGVWPIVDVQVPQGVRDTIDDYAQFGYEESDLDGYVADSSQDMVFPLSYLWQRQIFLDNPEMIVFFLKEASASFCIVSGEGTAWWIDVDAET